MDYTLSVNETRTQVTNRITHQEIVTVKHCKRCQRLLPLKAFHLQLGKHIARCKDCISEQNNRRRQAKTPLEAFLRFVTPLGPNECWLWQGAVSPQGYGKLTYKHKDHRAHRFAHEIFNGPIPSKLVVRHTCHNKLCVNPAHLLIGTDKDNTQDSARDGRLNRKLTAEQVQLFRALYEAGMPIRRIARELSMPYATVRYALQPGTHPYVT
jgi:hypothetical protein